MSNKPAERAAARNLTDGIVTGKGWTMRGRLDRYLCPNKVERCKGILYISDHENYSNNTTDSFDGADGGERDGGDAESGGHGAGVPGDGPGREAGEVVGRDWPEGGAAVFLSEGFHGRVYGGSVRFSRSDGEPGQGQCAGDRGELRHGGEP